MAVNYGIDFGKSLEDFAVYASFRVSAAQRSVPSVVRRAVDHAYLPFGTAGVDRLRILDIVLDNVTFAADGAWRYVTGHHEPIRMMRMSNGKVTVSIEHTAARSACCSLLDLL